jgi:trehalose utilization protein
LQSFSGFKPMKTFRRIFKHPWKKGRGAILFFSPGHHTRPYEV